MRQPKFRVWLHFPITSTTITISLSYEKIIFAWTERNVEGHIVLPGTRRALRYSSDAQGNAAVQEGDSCHLFSYC